MLIYLWDATLAKIKQNQFYLRYPNFANAAELTIMLLAGIAMMIFVPRVGPIWTLAGLVTVSGGLVWLAWHLYSERLILVYVTYPGAVTVMINAVLTFGNYTREAAEKKKVRGAFGMYLSPDLVNQLAENPDQLQLGGETKQMTFLFCDVRGFTSISETFKANPMGLTQLINRLLTPLTDAILSRNGTIDKYMGDCIMAFWNAPLDDEAHCEHACTSALAMFDELETLNAAREAEAKEAGEELSGRALARAPVGGGFPAPPFRLRGGFTVPPLATFPAAPPKIPDIGFSPVRLQASGTSQFGVEPSADASGLRPTQPYS